MHSRDIRLVCNGYYPEIHVIHPWSLEIVFSLSSRIQPDWISACCVLRPAKREGMYNYTHVSRSECQRVNPILIQGERGCLFGKGGYYIKYGLLVMALIIFIHILTCIPAQR